MSSARLRPLGRHRVLLVATVLLAAAGATCIGIAVAQGRTPPAPPLSRGDSLMSSRSPAPRAAGESPRKDAVKPATPVVGLVLNPSRPVGLSIPAINVQSPVRRLGQAADGSVQVPAPGPHYDQVGWYRYSPTPGSLGPSVIVGHVDSAANGPSVFWRLGSLHPRDIVRISRADGSVAVFAVVDVRRFPKTQFPSHLVYGNTTNAALRLITCGGPIEGGHYRDNIVVRASLIRATA
jgi:sortase (surface protein transpeptidase)